MCSRKATWMSNIKNSFVVKSKKKVEDAKIAEGFNEHQGIYTFGVK